MFPNLRVRIGIGGTSPCVFPTFSLEIKDGLVGLSQTVAVIKAENHVIEEIQYLARGGPDESGYGWR